jgi:hypothetical protein
MEVEVKASALEGAAMAGSDMWRKERGVACDQAASDQAWQVGFLLSFFLHP